MSVNWVMLNETGNDFTRLDHESKLWTSQPRTSLLVHSMNQYPGREPLSISSNTGRIHLTNRRVVYIPDRPTAQLQSFAAPLMNLYDAHVTTPFFGPNSWVSVVQPVPGGGIYSKANSGIELKLTFKDGGAFEFHEKFTQTRERVQQAVEASGQSSMGQNLASVHLEQLPAYEAGPSEASQARHLDATSTPQNSSAHPDEAPPGYEEVQREVVTERLGRVDLKTPP